ncbi:MAG TPA: response regulator [Allocoleopsis sp.]
MTSQKILIIDDSKTIRMQVKDMLPKANIEVLEAGDGVEGLELIHRETPNLVLLDFFMPRMNGWEVVEKLQTHPNPKFKALPIVLMSGRREDVEQQIPNMLEHFEFIGKPFEQPILVQAIKSAMVKAKSRQQTTTPAPVAPSNVKSTPANLGSTGATAANSQALIQALQAEVRSLRQENVALRTEFEGLKKQVGQILAFMRQKAK